MKPYLGGCSVLHVGLRKRHPICFRPRSSLNEYLTRKPSRTRRGIGYLCTGKVRNNGPRLLQAERNRKPL
ncbi:hypothetical protein BX666DRAFT_2008115 [Dichotomocladium elegans]|nr:hypothetical protein BX666DRAFT_2008115 [Dichotomocladium elegans]